MLDVGVRLDGESWILFCWSVFWRGCVMLDVGFWGEAGWGKLGSFLLECF